MVEIFLIKMSDKDAAQNPDTTRIFTKKFGIPGHSGHLGLSVGRGPIASSGVYLNVYQI